MGRTISNNIKEGDCFAQYLETHIEGGAQTARYTTAAAENPPVTKVMMNPPFALKRSDEKEFRFLDQALGQMQDEGLLFSVLPYSTMVKPHAYRQWRKYSLLPHHTLLAVVTFPIDVFYSVEVTTVGVFIRKGIPHPEGQNVLWVRALNDGLLKSKGKRLPSPRATDDLTAVNALVKAFIHNPGHVVENLHQFQRAVPIDFNDPDLELVPEAYLNQAHPTEDDIYQQLDVSIRNTLAYLIKINRAVIEPPLLTRSRSISLAPHEWRPFSVDDLFVLNRGHFH